MTATALAPTLETEDSKILFHPHNHEFRNGIRLSLLAGKGDLPEIERMRTVGGPILCRSFTINQGIQQPNYALAVFQGAEAIERSLSSWIMDMSKVASDRSFNPNSNWNYPNLPVVRSADQFFRLFVVMFTPQHVAHFGLSACIPDGDQLTPYHLFTRPNDPSPRLFHNGGMDDEMRTPLGNMVVTHYSGFAARIDTHVSIGAANIEKALIVGHKRAIYTRKMRIGDNFGQSDSTITSAIEALPSTSMLVLVTPPPTHQKIVISP